MEWTFLFGGLAVAGPVIAHLLARPRFRRLPFTMLRFLRSGQVESQSRRKLRDLLILLLRCAMIVLIALLFARPLLHVNPSSKQDGTAFFLGLDNSMSMAYSDADGSYFDRMVDQAIDYISSARVDPGTAAFNICALASGDWMRDLSKEQAIAEVKSLRVEPDSARVSDFISGLGRANGVQRSGRDVSVLVVSDFTPRTLSEFAGVAEPVAVDEMAQRQIVSSKPIDNAAIIDAHLLGLDAGVLTISCEVANRGQVEQHRQLAATAADKSSAPVEVSLSANQCQTYQVRIGVDPAGEEELFLPIELSLSGADGLKDDDTFYLAVSVPGRKDVNILLAGGSTHEMFLVRTALDTLSRINPYNTLNVREVLFADLGQSDFDWADVVVCSAPADRLSYLAGSMQKFVDAGGRFICFATETIDQEAVRQLWQRNVLAAMPGNCLHERMYAQPKPCDIAAFGVDSAAAKSLTNYRIDKVLLKGYLECKPHVESKCLWQLQNGLGFVYLKRHGRGISILVNTSMDDSLGTLTKSNASVAFCRYLLGESSVVREHSCVRGERVVLPVPHALTSSGEQKQFWVETCEGRKSRAAATDSFVVVPDPAGVGWVKVLGKPVTYAGVNLPSDETDMTRPPAGEPAGIVSRVFSREIDRGVARAGTPDEAGRKPLWRIIAWLIILLLLVEPVVANRLKR